MNRMHGASELLELDLNLLRLFDAIVRERQLTRAAASLGMSQSAASHAMARLRRAVGDPLFIRGTGNLQLTVRGEVLATAVQRALSDVARAITEPARFHPATATRLFTIGATDGFDLVVLPNLLRRLRDQAPGIDLAVIRPQTQNLWGSLESGEIDAYYGVLPGRPEFAGLLPDPGTAGLRVKTVYTEGWTCVVRRDHPRIGRKLSVSRYEKELHVVYSPTGGGPGVVDRMLAERGRTRRVALRVSNFHSALDAVRSTDFVWSAPTRIVAAVDPTGQCLHLRPPLPLPRYAVQLVWHERFDNDPAHRWLRGLVTTSSAG